MEVSDFGGPHIVRSVAELEQALRARFKNQMNGFMLHADSTDHPLLVIYVTSDLAVLFYHPIPDDPGFMSMGGSKNLDLEKITIFSLSNLHPETTIEVESKFVVPFSTALEVAKEFFHSQERPRSIEWLEL